ncbi:helix-turn-helix domain-containing protein [Corallococcus sp. CA053C]|uniref:helix-turn-helix domain-containing protein n=1 Tax=Corallococcus sp. CA053C TaxID=2316732 RepID=UPI000EA12B22|nr:helix-turn-helix domain-containing protein [Corallococcus sp. CA053C]
MHPTAYRNLLLIPQVVLAGELGITQGHLSRIERGIRTPSAALIRRIVSVTAGRVSADDLLSLSAPSVLVETAK